MKILILGGTVSLGRALVEAALARAERPQSAFRAFSHGMTVATNALLEGRGARTALVATDGFTDVVELGRQERPELYRLCAARPRPLVGQELRFGARERMTPEGPLLALGPEQARALAEQIAAARPESVAVALLHSYRHPQHEQAVAQGLGQALPDVHVSLSHEVVGTFREFERASTTEIDAALSPLLAGYLRHLEERRSLAELPEPAIMQSNGGLIDLTGAASHAAWTVLSGPAAGAAGAAFVARACGVEDALCFDMGGTSCDVCVIDGGTVQQRSSGEIAGRPIALPMLAIHTVGAGGGSIAWRDPGGALRVGPRSAGAAPGPACYRRGGSEPTVTDANLLLGYLADDAPLAGGVHLDRQAAERAVAQLAEQLDLAPLECAEGIRRVASAEMLRALRVVTVQRGIDPRGYALLAFGGAGPLHATQIADELEIETVFCPRASGVLAALGLVVSPRRREAQRSVLLSGDALSTGAVEQEVRALGEQARRALSDPRARLETTYELRYRGQSFELAIGGVEMPSPHTLRDAFEEEHEQRYGYRDADAELEVVTIRVAASSAPGDMTLTHTDDEEDVLRAHRHVTLEGREVELEVVRGAPAPGTEVRGPAVIELPESTVLVAPGWSSEVDATGTIRLQRVT